MTPPSAIYLPGLNGIRGIAAVSVVIAHLEVYKHLSGIPHVSLLTALGSTAVSLFFVLSGFLITYLLLSELKDTATIKVSHFYIRRALRIWPLYYLMIILGFFILPQFASFAPWQDGFSNEYYKHLALYVMLVPNIPYAVYGPIPFAGILWSIGVEEQFYLAWPLLLRKFKENPLRILITIIAVLLLLRTVLGYLTGFAKHYNVTEPYMRGAALLLYNLKFECMAIGGIGALLLLKKHAVLDVLYRKDVQLANIAAIILLTLFCPNLMMFEHAIFGVMFAVLILNVASNSDSVVKLENAPLNFLGRVSYGIYVYHVSFIILFLEATSGWSRDTLKFNVIYYVATITLTLATAALSYRYFERYFLARKDKYCVIRSNASVKTTREGSE